MADFDVRAFDDDGIDHSNDFDPVSDEGWFTPTDFAALGALYPFYLKHYNSAESAEIGATGTGLFNPFLNMNGDSTLVGFNTNDNVNNSINNANGTDISDPNTDALQLGDIPIVYRDLDGNGELEAYYVINLDINENVNKEVSLEELQIYTSSAPATIADYHFDEGAALAFEFNGGNAATDFTLRFDLDATGDNKLIMRDDGAGQGKLDYTFYLPVTMFAGSNSNTYLTLFSQFGPNPADDAGFAEWNTLVAAKISGTKFHDRNGDGTRDADGVDNIAGNSDDEAPLAGFTMYIDINGNNKLDANEQTAITDANGNFTFGSLLPNAQYIVREVLTSADVNGPGDPGTDVNFALYAPPAGLWDQTTDDGTGDQVVNVTTGTTNILVGNRLLNPALNILKDVSSITGGQGANGLTGADSAGDVINYSITVQNTGDVTLTGVTVTDPNADVGSITRIADLVGDNDGLLEVGETWAYTATHTVTQAELDNQGGGDSDVDNVATADSDQTGPDTDTASAPLVYNPALNILKDVTSITGGQGVNGLTGADGAGDLINYSITVQNTGNVTLTGVTVTDPNADVGSIVRIADLVGDNDGDLEVGETWAYTATHTVTQAELDNQGGGDNDVDNIATADSNETGPDTDPASAPLIYNPALNILKDVTSITGGQGVNGLTGADSAGDVINYAITVQNTGNVTLTGVTVTDPNADVGSIVRIADLVGDNDGDLEVGETWAYTATHTVTQAELDNQGGGDNDVDNIATADSNETGPDTDPASAPLIYNPALNILKDVTSITGGQGVNGLTGADSAGDLINYSITVQNTGNVTLTGVTVTDPNADVGSIVRIADLVGDNDGDLEVGETWAYTATHTVTQAELDNQGGGDNDVDNIASADSNETGPDTDPASAPLIYNPLIDIEKSVMTDVNGAFEDADDPDGPEASTSSTVNFRVVLTNTGNVTLTAIALSDSVIHTVGGIPGAPVAINYSDPSLNAFIDLDGDEALDSGEKWANFDTDADGTLDVDENGDPFELSVGETVSIYYSLTSALGQHENTVAVTTGEAATDSDDANYYVLADEDCVGVRTPGFWSNPKWMTFWDAKGEGWGTPANEPSQAGTPGFADGELLYKVYLSDTNGDTVIDTNDAFSTGLLVGDYNQNGITDAGEDTIFISLSDAQKLINASSKQLVDGKTADGTYMLGRDAVATWLNYLANNQETIGGCIGDVDSGDGTNTPREYLDAAIDWFQQFASTSNGNANQNLVNSYHDGSTQALFQFDARVAPSSAAWQNPFLPGEDIPVSAAAMHSALDGYNNTGAINGVEYCCDADSQLVHSVLTQVALI